MQNKQKSFMYASVFLLILAIIVSAIKMFFLLIQATIDSFAINDSQLKLTILLLWAILFFVIYLIVKNKDEINLNIASIFRQLDA